MVGCHGNKGQSGVNLKDTVRLADPENPHARIFKVAELQLLEVAIGLNAILKIFGSKVEKILIFIIRTI